MMLPSEPRAKDFILGVEVITNLAPTRHIGQTRENVKETFLTWDFNFSDFDGGVFFDSMDTSDDKVVSI